MYICQYNYLVYSYALWENPFKFSNNQHIILLIISSNGDIQPSTVVSGQWLCEL